jgi:hypothetical protein
MHKGKLTEKGVKCNSIQKETKDIRNIMEEPIYCMYVTKYVVKS